MSTGDGDTAPPEGVAEAYSPDAVAPDFPDGYRPPDGDGPYNSWTDPYHPLKNPDKDPGAAWDRPPGANLPDNSPGVLTSTTDWPWGEKYYASEFDASLVITNNCDTPQPVKITIDNLPYLTLPEGVSRTTVRPTSGPSCGRYAGFDADGPPGLDVVDPGNLP